MFFVIETPKRHILGWIRVVWCIDRVYPSTRFCCRRRQEKKGKERKGKGRYTKSQVGYISPIWGSDPFGPISTKIGTLVGIHDVIIQSKFGFTILRGFRSTGGRNLHFPIDFAGHRYNSAAATAQPVMLLCCLHSMGTTLTWSRWEVVWCRSNRSLFTGELTTLETCSLWRSPSLSVCLSVCLSRSL